MDNAGKDIDLFEYPYLYKPQHGTWCCSLQKRYFEWVVTTFREIIPQWPNKKQTKWNQIIQSTRQ